MNLFLFSLSLSFFVASLLHSTMRTEMCNHYKIKCTECQNVDDDDPFCFVDSILKMFPYFQLKYCGLQLKQAKLNWNLWARQKKKKKNQRQHCEFSASRERNNNWLHCQFKWLFCVSAIGCLSFSSWDLKKNFIRKLSISLSSRCLFEKLLCSSFYSLFCLFVFVSFFVSSLVACQAAFILKNKIGIGISLLVMNALQSVEQYARH